MITNLVSSTAQLALAPAKLAGRIGESVFRGLRGIAADSSPASSSSTSRPASQAPARTQPKRGAARTRANAKPKRAAAQTRAKAEPKRAAAQSGAKAEPKRAAAQTRAKAGPKRAASGTRATARPERAPQRTPLDDVTIARKVESIIFRDIDVDKGKVDVNVAGQVVWLRGEVRTGQLIAELEDRASRVAEVRRVENLLHLPESPAPGRTETPAQQPETNRSAAPPPAENPAVLPATSGETVASAYQGSARPGESRSEGQPPALGSADSAARSAPGHPDSDRSADETKRM